MGNPRGFRLLIVLAGVVLLARRDPLGGAVARPAARRHPRPARELERSTSRSAPRSCSRSSSRSSCLLQPALIVAHGLLAVAPAALRSRPRPVRTIRVAVLEACPRGRSAAARHRDARRSGHGRPPAAARRASAGRPGQRRGDAASRLRVQPRAPHHLGARRDPRQRARLPGHPRDRRRPAKACSSSTSCPLEDYLVGRPGGGRRARRRSRRCAPRPSWRAPTRPTTGGSTRPGRTTSSPRHGAPAVPRHGAARRRRSGARCARRPARCCCGTASCSRPSITRTSGGYTEDPRTVFATGATCPRSSRSAWSSPPARPISSGRSTCPLADLSASSGAAGSPSGASALEVTERTRLAARGRPGPRHAGQRAAPRQRLPAPGRLRHVKSTLFAVAVDGEVARFSGRGYGHGVGMCQGGAKAMAEQGYTREQILELLLPGRGIRRHPLTTRPAMALITGTTSRRSTCGWAWSSTPRSFPRRGAPPTSSGSTSAARRQAVERADHGPLPARRPGRAPRGRRRELPAKQIGPFVSEVLVLGAYDEAER